MICLFCFNFLIMAALRTLVISRKVLIAVAKETQLIAEDATPKQVEEIHQKLSKALSLSLIGDELVRINFIWHDQSQMKPVGGLKNLLNVY